MSRQQMLVIQLTEVRVFGEVADERIYLSEALQFEIPRHPTVNIGNFVIDFRHEVYTDETWYRIFNPRYSPSAIEECRLVAYFGGFPYWSLRYR